MEEGRRGDREDEDDLDGFFRMNVTVLKKGWMMFFVEESSLRGEIESGISGRS